MRRIDALLLSMAALVIGCSCRLPRPEDPMIGAFGHARDYTVRIDLPGMGMGTGWIVGPGRVYTAGHVCTPGALHLVTTRDGTSYLADPIYDSDDSPQVGDEDFDSCILEVFGLEAKGAPIHEGTSASLPLGGHVYYTGYPSSEMAALEGRLVGFGEGRFSASLWGWFGASGSAVWMDGRVMGMLVSINPRFPQITHLVDLDSIHWVLANFSDPLAIVPGHEPDAPEVLPPPDAPDAG